MHLKRVAQGDIAVAAIRGLFAETVIRRVTQPTAGSQVAGAQATFP